MPKAQVLVVDDDPKVCRIVEKVLSRDGICVRTAANGQQGLELLRQQPFHVLFADLFPPGMDGLTVIRQGLRIQPSLAVVVFVGRSGVEVCLEALRLGARDYLAKPFTAEMLQSALARALKSGIGRHGCAEAPADGALGEVSLQLDDEEPWSDLVMTSPAMREIGALVAKVAPTRVPVLIQGEVGVGKEGVAWAIHRRSRRADQPFLRVPCSALREHDLDQKLFGQDLPEGEEGGAKEAGLLERAHGGTLFLHDVDHLPLWAQAKLLHAIRRGRFSAGSGGPVQPLNVRLIAATACDLETSVRDGRFDPSLYYYLNVISLRVPPLRHRPQDIRPLVERFLERAAGMQPREDEIGQWHLSPKAWDTLRSHQWPGNLRELISVVSRAILLDDENELTKAIAAKIPHASTDGHGAEAITIPLTGDLLQIERHIVEEVIVRFHGNKAAAARSLGLHRRTLYRLLQEHPR